MTPSGEDEAPAAPGEGADMGGDGTVPADPPPGSTAQSTVKRSAGRQPGAPGVGRTQKLAVDIVIDHHPGHCAVCDRPFPADAPGQAYGGYDEIDLLPADPNEPGLRLWVTRHRPFELVCACGHRSRYPPVRALVLPES